MFEMPYVPYKKKVKWKNLFCWYFANTIVYSIEKEQIDYNVYKKNLELKSKNKWASNLILCFQFLVYEGVHIFPPKL